jgi:hypothetical protein
MGLRRKHNRDPLQVFVVLMGPKTRVIAVAVEAQFKSTQLPIGTLFILPPAPITCRPTVVCRACSNYEGLQLVIREPYETPFPDDLMGWGKEDDQVMCAAFQSLLSQIIGG